MKILQLCFFKTDYWDKIHSIEAWDIKNGKNILDLPDDYGKEYDLILAAPPCTQFTKANNHNWQEYPTQDINIAKKCLTICTESKKPFIFETVPGRLEKFIPEIKMYRAVTWQSNITGKQHNLYSNILLTIPIRVPGRKTINNYTKTKREQWQPDLVEDLRTIINLIHTDHGNTNTLQRMQNENTTQTY